MPYASVTTTQRNPSLFNWTTLPSSVFSQTAIISSATPILHRQYIVRLMGMMEVEERRVAEDKDINVGPWLDCSICLEAASEPVVTLCGHLYCWPCMFRWLNSRHHGSARCPVCKAAVSEDHLVPLYGRGRPANDAAAGRCKQGDVGGEVPRRPPVPNVEQHRRRLQEQDDDGGMDVEYYQGSWEPNAECLLGGIALAVLLPRRLPPPLHVHLRYGGEQRRRLQQIWVVLAMVALLCFLLL